MIDGNPVVAKFIEHDAPVIVGMKLEEWKACHVRQSQYFLQIVKCTDPKCCSSFQSSYLKVVPKRFLPPPLPVVHTRNGTEWAKDATYLSLYQNIFLQNAYSSYKEISQGNTIQLFLSICGSRYDQTTNVFSLWLIIFIP